MHPIRPLILVVLFSLTTFGCAVGSSFPVPEQVVRGDRQSCLYQDEMGPSVIADFPLYYQSGSDTLPRKAHLMGMSLWNTALARSSPNDPDDFSFVRELEVFVRFSDGSGEVRIASWSGPRPDGIYSLDLDVDQTVDLEPYIEWPSMVSIIAQGEVPCSDFSFEGNADVAETM